MKNKILVLFMLCVHFSACGQTDSIDDGVIGGFIKPSPTIPIDSLSNMLSKIDQRLLQDYNKGLEGHMTFFLK